MRLPYVIVTLAMLASVSTAQAIPNMWTSGFGMGVTEYIISSPEKVIFNPSAGGMAITPGCHLLTRWFCRLISMFTSTITKLAPLVRV